MTTETSLIPTVHTRRVFVGSSKEQDFAKILERANRKLGKAGLEAIEVLNVEEGAKEVIEGKLHGGCLYTIAYHAPDAGEWTLTAKLDHLGDANVVHGYGDAALPDGVEEIDPACEHCGKNRRRKTTYLLHGPDGTIQVGSTCIDDFLGDGNLARFRTFEKALGHVVEQPWSTSADVMISLDGFLPHVAASIEEHGWQKRVNGRTPTGTDSMYRLQTDCGVTTEHKELARKARLWAEDLDDRDLEPGSFLANINAVAANGFIRDRNAQLAAAILIAYLNEQKRENAKKDASQSPSKHVGEIGERLVREVKVTHRSEHDGYYGVTTLHKFIDRDGNRLNWWASRDPDFPEDEWILVKATVKKHGEFRGIPETTVNRVSRV